LGARKCPLHIFLLNRFLKENASPPYLFFLLIADSNIIRSSSRESDKKDITINPASDSSSFHSFQITRSSVGNNREPPDKARKKNKKGEEDALIISPDVLKRMSYRLFFSAAASPSPSASFKV
jgi:hypothetical protein